MKMRLLFCFLAISTIGFSQQIYQDLDFDELKQLKAKYLNEQDILEVRKIAKVYLEKAKRNKDNHNIATGYFYFSQTFNDQRLINYSDSIILLYDNLESDIFFPCTAYFIKGNYLSSNEHYSEALSNYIKAEEYAQKGNNKSIYLASLESIGTIQSEKMGDYKKALEIYQKVFFYSKRLKSDSSIHYLPINYAGTIFGLADVHKSLNNLDSSSYYNKLGWFFSNEQNYLDYKSLFSLNEGAVQSLKGNHLAALDSINIALPSLRELKDTANILASYYYYGKAYEGIGNKKSAIKNFKKVDSLYLIRKNINPEFISAYNHLINHYKQTGNKEKQLYYINRLLTIEQQLKKQYKELSSKIYNDYETPKLLQEKQRLISDLEQKSNNRFWVILITSSLGILSIFSIFLYFKRRESKNKKRFLALMEEKETKNTITTLPTDKENKNSQEEITSNNLDLPESLVNEILDSLTKFEEKEQFLQKGLTSKKIAVKLNTNTKYLSNVLNAKLGKSLPQYLNDLRIDYAVDRLKNDEKFRKYSIKAISEECGYGTSESFSKAFTRKTKLKPSFFIKELSNS